jgi:hypothetical protein
MNKKFFASLMLGFGASLGVLIAVAMPPGGWGVTVGVMLGLLASVPLFIVLLMVLSRDRSRPAKHYEEQPQPQIIVMPQPQVALPYGANVYAQPGYELYNTPDAYGQFEAPEGYEYYPQGYLAQPQPQPRRQQPRPQPQPQQYYEEAPRLRPAKRRPQPGYYIDPNAAYEQQYYTQQPDPYYAEPEAYDNYYYDQPQPGEYYDERNYNQPPLQAARRTQQRYAEYEEDYGTYQPEPAPERQRPATQPGRTRRSNIPTTPQNDEPIEAQFRTLGDM